MTKIASWVKQRLTTLKNRKVGRFAKRISISVVVIIAALALTVWLRKFVGNSLLNDVPILLSGLIAYIFYLDQKKLEIIYKAKLGLYKIMLVEIAGYYELPLAVFKEGIDFNKKKEFLLLPGLSNITNPSVSLEAILVANNESTAALFSIYKKIQEITLSMSLHIYQNRQIIPDGDIVEMFKFTLNLFVSSLLSLKEINKLNMLLINEMRRDLELGAIQQAEVDKMSEAFDLSVRELFNFLKKVLDSTFSFASAGTNQQDGDNESENDAAG